MFNSWSLKILLFIMSLGAGKAASQGEYNLEDFNGFVCTEIWAEMISVEGSDKNWHEMHISPSKSFAISTFSDDRGTAKFGLRTIGETTSRSHLFTMECQRFTNSITCGGGRFYMRKSDGVFINRNIRGNFVTFSTGKCRKY